VNISPVPSDPATTLPTDFSVPKILYSRAYTRAAGSCRLSPMVDIDLIVQTLRQHGHRVDSVISVPANAGEYEIVVDGNALNLEEARALLERDEAK
jgi:hypothetical protein